MFKCVAKYLYLMICDFILLIPLLIFKLNSFEKRIYTKHVIPFKSYCSLLREVRIITEGWVIVFLSVFNPSWRRRHPGRREGLEFNLTTPGSLCMARMALRKMERERKNEREKERTARKGCVSLTAPRANYRDNLGRTSGMNNVCHELSLHGTSLRTLRQLWEGEGQARLRISDKLRKYQRWTIHSDR